MRKFVIAALAATSLLAAPPVASAGPDLPPTDVLDGGASGCQPDYPCDIRPYTVDKTYPSRVVAWVKAQP